MTGRNDIGPAAPETGPAGEALEPAAREQAADEARRVKASPRPIRGMSGKLLVLTILFIMMSEVLIYVPSIANFRNNWLHERLAAAQIASLVSQATPERSVSARLQRELLANVGARAIAIRRSGARHLLLGSNEPLIIDRHYDMRDRSTLGAIWDAFETLAAPGGRTIRVAATPGKGGGDFIEIVMHEQPLRAAMFRFSANILTLSLVISALTAGLVFLSLNWLLVRPMRRLTGAMVRFGERPEDADRIIEPSSRRDEIGTAERELENMQRELAQTLQQKNRLAALGLAVSKVSHDLRNMLASAQLLSDRLGSVDDPTVRHIAPKLIASIDRAIAFCADTLKYGRAREAPPRRKKFPLAALAQEVFDDLKLQLGGDISWVNNVPVALEVDAGRDHIFRILSNLGRNAAQAIRQSHEVENGEIVLDAWREGTVVTVVIHDNGPGLPQRAREHLFEAFQGVSRTGGTGLGLAIAAELVRTHGGEIALDDTDIGTRFVITIPDRVPDISKLRRQA